MVDDTLVAVMTNLRPAVGARGGKVLIVGSSVRAVAAWVLPAEPSAVGQLRRLAVEFASSAGAADEATEDIALAVSEIVTNAVVHAYDGAQRRQVRVSCHVDGERFIIEVADERAGIGPPCDSSGTGHGLAVVGALVQALDIAPGPHRRGTVVTMTFGPVRPSAAVTGLEMLCALALETVADVSCVDLVHDGVLRRVAAEVADDPALTSWLRVAVPPVRPGRRRGRRCARVARESSSTTPLSRVRRGGLVGA